MNKAKIIECFENLSGRITLGIDGFVDEVWQVVQSRTSSNDVVLYDKMKNFGDAIVMCEKGGLAREIIRKRRSYGGFTCNTGKAVGRLGGNSIMLGMFGKDKIDSAFEQFKDLSEIISVGDPGLCHIFEFEDGKAMFPNLDALYEISWKVLHDVIGTERLDEIFKQSQIIALGYWSSMPFFDDLVSGICENYIIAGRCERMFFDFADLKKRDKNSLKHTIEQLAARGSTVKMTLSLNEHEASLLFSYFGETFDETCIEKAVMQNLRKKIGLNEIVVHTPHIAVAVNADEGFASVQQIHCPKPVITAGAGDTFNGGYLIGALGGLDLTERLILSNAVTRLYVRQGYAPDVSEVLCELSL